MARDLERVAAALEPRSTAQPSAPTSCSRLGTRRWLILPMTHTRPKLLEVRATNDVEARPKHVPARGRILVALRCSQWDAGWPPLPSTRPSVPVAANASGIEVAGSIPVSDRRVAGCMNAL